MDGRSGGHFNFAETGHYNFAATPLVRILGTYGLALRWFGCSVFVVSQAEGGRVIHRAPTFLAGMCCVLVAPVFVALSIVWRRNGRTRQAGSLTIAVLRVAH